VSEGDIDDRKALIERLRMIRDGQTVTSTAFRATLNDAIAYTALTATASAEVRTTANAAIAALSAPPTAAAPEAVVRQFPMGDGPPIPWSLAEALYAGYSQRYGTQQSLERLAERGGFGWGEIAIFWNEAGHGERFRKTVRAALAGEQTGGER
jgi:hypothetical protein